MNYVRSLPALQIEERFGPVDEVPAATPSETLLAALGSCLSARVHANAASGNILVHGLEIEVEADIMPNSMWGPHGREPGPVGFETIRVAVHIQADATPDVLRALIGHALLWSPVANTLHGPVHLDIALGRTEGVGARPDTLASGP